MLGLDVDKSDVHHLNVEQLQHLARTALFLKDLTTSSGGADEKLDKDEELDWEGEENKAVSNGQKRMTELLWNSPKPNSMYSIEQV